MEAIIVSDDRFPPAQAARIYAERFGWPVCPAHSIRPDGQCSCGNPECSSPGKHPRTEHGLKDASANVDQIAAWWAQWPDANIIVRTGTASRLLVLDIDPDHGGGDSLAQLEADYGPLPVTVEAETGGGGRHILFHHPGSEFRNTAGKLGPGLDTRGENGYVIAAPSCHRSGRVYRWKEGRKPGQVAVANAPDWLLDRLRPRERREACSVPMNGNGHDPSKRAYAESALSDETRAVASAHEGERNHALNRAAFNLGQLVAGGYFEREMIERALTDAALRAGLDDQEIERTLASGLDAGMAEPREIPDRVTAPECRASVTAEASPASSGDTTVTTEVEWPDPESFLAPNACPRLYPVDVLPKIMRDAVVAYQRYGQQPVELVASSAIATASLAAQGLANVARDRVLIGPLSLNLLVIANSGERKTSADRRMARAAREWQEARREDMASAVSEAQAQIAAYKAEREGILGKIKRCAGADSHEKRDELTSLRKRLEELDALPPKEPVLPRLFYEDATQEAFGLRLATGWSSASIWSDEGGLVVGSHGMGDDSAMRFLTLLNRLWDGDPFQRDRNTTESFQIRGRRLTACLMMQDVVFTRLLAASGGAARGVGFLARFLICRPESTMGMRLYVEGDAENAANAGFDHRIRALLEYPLPIEGDDLALSPPVVSLSPDAKAHWVEFHNEVEREIGSMGEFTAVRDIAAKTAENAARLAGVFHVFEHGPEGEVSADTMERGARVAAWHLYEARRLIESNQEPQSILDAATLLQWLRTQGRAEFTYTELAKNVPYALRNTDRRKCAIAVLCERSYVRDEKRGNVSVLHINPEALK